jgi:hypothetical protein
VFLAVDEPKRRDHAYAEGPRHVCIDRPVPARWPA